MKQLYLLLSLLIGFTVSGCAAVGSTDQPIKPDVQNQTSPNPSLQDTQDNKIVRATETTQKTKKSESPVKKKKATNNAFKQCPYKNPMAVQVYPQGIQLNHPYQVIAKESVSKFNKGGIKRQEANIHDTLRNLAASVGGDAVINVTHEQNRIVGTIIKFDQDPRLGSGQKLI